MSAVASTPRFARFRNLEFILGALLAACGAKEAAYAAVLPMLAAAACEIHGLAGELAQEKYGAHAMNSADIIEFLPEVFKTYVE